MAAEDKSSQDNGVDHGGDFAAGSPGAAGTARPLAAMIEDRIAEIRARQGDTVPLGDVAGVVRALLGSLSGDLTAEDIRLYREVEDLARYIQSAKAEIAALNPADIREEFLPTAADELDAIVQSTEAATGEIMDAAESIEDLLVGLPDDAAERLRAATTRIYEACSFQDITGQRVTKVVRTLKSIEERVDGLVRAFEPERHGIRLESPGRPAGTSTAQAWSGVAATGDRAEDVDLLNGPQGQGEAIKQDDVDALLAKFD
ncbi:MAG: protein phosphatase CheZ [Rhodospirillaceae bacterium]